MDNVCKEYSATSIQQLTKLITDTQSRELKEKNIYPISLVQSIFDGITGNRLDVILSLFNCIYIPYGDSKRSTRLKVPNQMRRLGLIITFKDATNAIYTQQYVGDSFDDANWGNDKNWEDCFVSFDSSEAVEQLKQYFTNYINNVIGDITGVKFVVVTSLPSVGEKGTIYLMKNNSSTEANNIYDEYIWLADKSSYEKLGSFSTSIDLSNYQLKLVSGENIKTINGESILGSGDIKITAGNAFPSDGVEGQYLKKSDTGVKWDDGDIVYINSTEFDSSPISQDIYDKLVNAITNNKLIGLCVNIDNNTFTRVYCICGMYYANTGDIILEMDFNLNEHNTITIHSDLSAEVDTVKPFNKVVHKELLSLFSFDISENTVTYSPDTVGSFNANNYLSIFKNNGIIVFKVLMTGDSTILYPYRSVDDSTDVPGGSISFIGILKYNDIFYDITVSIVGVYGDDIDKQLVIEAVPHFNIEDIPNASQSKDGLMSAEDKAKLDDVSNNANNYTHPTGSAASKSLGLYKISTDSTSHVQSVSAITKSDITGLGIPAQDTTYNNATSTASGLMSASDKEKLDSINVDNATINIVADAKALKGATMRFSGFVSGVTITQTETTEWDSIVYDTSINKFLAKKENIYYNVWSGMNTYMSDEIGTSILKDKLYIYGEDVYIWSDTEGTLVKADKEILKDDVPVEDSNNLVKSSGISLATRYSKKEINDMELLYANKYLSNGSLLDGNNYNLYYLDISDYTDEIISINGSQVYYSLWGLAKKDGDNIEIIHTSESRISSATINLSEYKIYGANTLLVCNNRNLVVLRDHYSSITNQLSSSINNSTIQTYAPINTIFDIGNANVGDVIDMTHIVIYANGYNITSVVCDCEEGEVFYVTSKKYVGTNYSGHHIVILDDNNAVIWRPYNNIDFDNYKIVIPHNGKKIIATNTITKIEKQTAYKDKEVYVDCYGEDLNVFLTNGRIGGISDSIESLSIGDTIESLTITAWYSYYRAFCCYCKEGDFFTYTAKNAVPTICVAFFDENLRLLKKEYAYNSNVHLSVAPAQSAICYMWFTYASDNQGTAINTTFDVLKNSDKASFNYWDIVNKNFCDLLNIQVETIKSILRDNSYFMLNSSLENYLAVSHRGYMSEAPENTLPGYKCAKQHGFDYSETDILFTSDNVPVCIHDDTINRTALNADGTVISETIRVDSLTLAEIEQYDFSRIIKNSNPEYPFTKIPTLKEFLTLCRNIGIHPYIELKGAFSTEQINIICDAVREVGLIGKVTYISYYADNLELVKSNCPVCRLGLLSDSTNQTKINTAAALKNEYNYVFLNINYSYITQSVVTMCKTAGIRLETWVTASSSNETAEKILALDPYINGVTANALNAKTIIYEGNIN